MDRLVILSRDVDAVYSTFTTHTARYNQLCEERLHLTTHHQQLSCLVKNLGTTLWEIRRVHDRNVGRYDSQALGVLKSILFNQERNRDKWAAVLGEMEAEIDSQSREIVFLHDAVQRTLEALKELYKEIDLAFCRVGWVDVESDIIEEDIDGNSITI